ncbi:bacterio-opsin activator HTH domain-containing protein [Halococcus morrhuae DSM 1307]|uniref:Bacterio-opsin activator HTH domain-containing protein n=1 Tax=Halococcus morrhuae DSM 1307 TaxID=931277 RepID=M0MGU1_HALMO|nr:helix-turn-helix domain-containing protein [Halococcus morrhuae]EMA44553.1 bacterio-opsin activator HTH domain-containing protein [Halococcus morrhuae DSM 1307]
MVPPSQSAVGLRVTLDIWHPDCWTLTVTEDADGGLLGHGVYPIDGAATGRFTVYGETTDAVERLVAAIQNSPLTDSVWETDHLHATSETVPGSASRAIVVRYAIENSINDALVSRGFIPDEPVRMHGGREYWTVIVQTDRATLGERLDAVRAENDAEIRIEDIVVPRGGPGVLPTDDLSGRQREVFDLARRRNYYAWPREVSATELAEELDVAKATLLEHLRKAEAKLFGHQ